MGRFGSGLYHGCLNAPKKKLHPFPAYITGPVNFARVKKRWNTGADFPVALNLSARCSISFLVYQLI
jgi:hypothetical protein